MLTCLHQNSLGLDEFLGQVTLPLNEMDVYEQPRSRWFKLLSKPGKEKAKDRGELEVRIGFTVKSGSMTDLSKKEKHKSSMGQLASNVRGSLLSINTLEKRKKMKNFAKSLGSKMHITGKKGKDKDKNQDNDSMAGSTSNVWPTPDQHRRRQPLGGGGQMAGEADPGVISEDEDEFAFENLSHKSSGSSLNVRGFQQQQRVDRRSPAVSVHSSAADVEQQQQRRVDREGEEEEAMNFANRSMTLPTPPKPQRTAQQPDEWAEKLYGKTGSGSLGSSDSLKRRSWEPSAAAVATGRVPIDSSEAVNRNSPATTAPSSPAVVTKTVVAAANRSSLPATAETPPQPLPRHSMESIEAETGKVGKKGSSEKEKENKFTKKLKYLRDFGRSEAAATAAAGGDRRIKPTLSGQFYNNQSERIIIGHENDVRQSGELPKEVVQRYEGKTREVSREGVKGVWSVVIGNWACLLQEIMTVSYQLENEVKYQKQRVKELEDYLDNLLLRVMETHPKILQSPYTKLNATKSG